MLGYGLYRLSCELELGLAYLLKDIPENHSRPSHMPSVFYIVCSRIRRTGFLMGICVRAFPIQTQATLTADLSIVLDAFDSGLVRYRNGSILDQLSPKTFRTRISLTCEADRHHRQRSIVEAGV
jgi:hypothetical protein